MDHPSRLTRHLSALSSVESPSVVVQSKQKTGGDACRFQGTVEFRRLRLYDSRAAELLHSGSGALAYFRLIL